MGRQFFAATVVLVSIPVTSYPAALENTLLDSQIPVDEPPAPPHTNPLNAIKLSALAPTLRIIQNCAAEIRQSVKTVQPYLAWAIARKLTVTKKYKRNCNPKKRKNVFMTSFLIHSRRHCGRVDIVVSSRLNWCAN